MPRPAKLDLALALPILPLLILQVAHLRRVTPRLPEPPGNRHGRRGDGTPLRLLILGDSAAAGVGAEHQDQALLGRVVAALADIEDLEWRLLARTGATTADTLQSVREHPDLRCDIAITSLGVNDVTALRSTAAFLATQHALVDHLRQHCGASRILISGLPPMHAFPLMPQPLRGFVGRHARRLDSALADWIEQQPDCEHLPFGELPTPDLMASDGFHPGPAIYEEWGARVAATIRRQPARDRAA